VYYLVLCRWSLKAEWELLDSGVGGTLGSSLGETVGDGFSGAVSSSESSGIRVEG